MKSTIQTKRIPSIYQRLVAAKAEITNERSDLYTPINEATTKIINHYRQRDTIARLGYRPHISKFWNQVAKAPYYCISFAYEPFWTERTVVK